MNVTSIVNNIGAVGTLGMGCLGFFRPHAASRFTGLTATNKTAFAEFRATFGGSFVLMGLAPLISQSRWAFCMAGLFWLGAAAGRVVSIALDGGHRESKNVGGVFFEGAFGVALLVGNWSL
jgi:Domain of unknown function (DUF4345)